MVTSLVTNLFNELKRRNIIRVAGVYAVVGWLVIQLAIALETALNLPGWFDTVLTSAVLIGFPIALVLAWAFELTPKGMKRTEAVTEGESIRPQTERKMDVAIMAGLALVAVLVVGNRLIPASAPVAPTITAESDTPAAVVGTSIAVLPFADMSQAKDQEYFSDGMAEEILNALTKVGDLRVAGRTSSFSFKGKDDTIQDIGTALKVEHVLEGSVRKQGENVRITAQLIRASDGFHLWSDTYDGTLENIFTLQDTVAQAITRELQIKLDIGQETLVETLTANKEAYDLYLQALEKIRKGWGKDVLGSAIRMLERAVDLDPNFTQAWVALARANSFLPHINTVLDDMVYLDAAVKAATRALAIDPENQEAKLALIYVRGQRGNLAYAVDEFNKAERAGHQISAEGALTAFRMGQTRSAIPRLEQAVESDPYRGDLLFNLGKAKFRIGDVVSAETYTQQCIDVGFVACAFLMADIHTYKGNSQAAIDTFMDAYDSSGDQYATQVRSRELWQVFADAIHGGDSGARRQITASMQKTFDNPNTRTSESLLAILIALGEADMFFELYDRNQIAAIGPVISYLWDPYETGAKAVRQHKDFPVFAEKVGLIEIWQKHGWADLCRPNLGTDGSGGNFTCD